MSRSKVKVTRDKKTCYALPSPPAAMEWNALAANNVTHQQMGPFCCCRGWFRRLVYGLCLVKYL